VIDPRTLKYTPTHEWVHLEGDVATIGISRFAVDQLTDLILIDLGRAKPGSRVEPGKSFGEVESVKAVADLYAPVAGEVIEVNPAVLADVQALAEDPYEKGWLLRIKVADPAALSGLLDHEAYQAKLEAEPH
jgi:glycine cleavage system H protein